MAPPLTEIKNEEGKITERLALLEQQMVSPPMLALARMGGREVNGMTDNVDTVVDRLADDMECLVACADYLREKTMAKVIGLLTTGQSARFLAGVAQLQLRVRRWGQLRDAEADGQDNLSVDKQETARKSRQARVDKQESASKSRQARDGKQESSRKSRQARVDKKETDGKQETSIDEKAENTVKECTNWKDKKKDKEQEALLISEDTAFVIMGENTGPKPNP
ncbi:DOG1-like protein 4, partial [Tanacetum coccineum]